MYPLKPFDIEFPTPEQFELFWVKLATAEASEQLVHILLNANERAVKESRELIAPDKLKLRFRARSCYIGLMGSVTLQTGIVLEFDNPMSNTHPTWVGYITLTESGHFERIYEVKDLDRTRSRIMEMQPRTDAELAEMTRQMLQGKLN